jgi:hypothetical protein
MNCRIVRNLLLLVLVLALMMPVVAFGDNGDMALADDTGASVAALEAIEAEALVNGQDVKARVVHDKLISWDEPWPPPSEPVAPEVFPEGGSSGMRLVVDWFGQVQTFSIAPDGSLLDNVAMTSPDGLLTLEIAKGTVAHNTDGTPVT